MISAENLEFSLKLVMTFCSGYNCENVYLMWPGEIKLLTEQRMSASGMGVEAVIVRKSP